MGSLEERCLGRRRFMGGLLLVPVLGVVSACGARPIPPPLPIRNGFDLALAQETIARADRLAASGNSTGAIAAYREGLMAWPVLVQGWTGLRRTAEAAQQEGEARLALFFESRVVEYDTMYPLQARMAFAGVASQPPANPPGLGPWAQRMVAFFTYKDEVTQREIWDAGRR